MEKIKALAMSILMVLISTVTFAQTEAVSGTVTDNSGEPIIGATVLVVGQSGNGTVTDLDGNFTLQVNPSATLSISYIGYKSQEVKAGKDLYNPQNEMLSIRKTKRIFI